MRYLFVLYLLVVSVETIAFQRVRDLGIEVGVIPPGKYNAITDVDGISVGHKTLILGDSIRTGVTVVLPHQNNIFQEKVPAGFYAGNGFGKITGTTQIIELGNIETPIALTNTLSVHEVARALVRYTLQMDGNENVYSVNPVVGETNDGYLNHIRAMVIDYEDVVDAIRVAKSGEVAEGNVGAGTGTVCFGYKGGIGTSSRTLPKNLGGYTVGVLVQSNFGGNLTVNGALAGKALSRYSYKNQIESADGSCMIIIATDAPIDARNLTRLAKRSMIGLGRTGGIASNGSGDYAIAFSTDPSIRIPYSPAEPLQTRVTLHNDFLSPLFMACIEAVEEAILNSLFQAKTMTGYKNRTIEALPVESILPLLKED
jgi:D-aminopeptidase